MVLPPFLLESSLLYKFLLFTPDNTSSVPQVLCQFPIPDALLDDFSQLPCLYVSDAIA